MGVQRQHAVDLHRRFPVRVSAQPIALKDVLPCRFKGGAKAINLQILALVPHFNSLLSVEESLGLNRAYWTTRAPEIGALGYQ